MNKKFLYSLVFFIILSGCQTRPQTGAWVTFYSDPPNGTADGNSMPRRYYWDPQRLPIGFPNNCANVLTPTVRWPDGTFQGPSTIRICSFESIYTISKPASNHSSRQPSASSTYQTLTYKNGDSYYGQAQNGKRSGFGTYYFKNGDKYEGYFQNDLFHGSGKYTFKNGNYFVGNYRNDQRDGPGKLFNSAGVILQDGLWSNGTLISTQSGGSQSKSNQSRSIIENKVNNSAEQRCLGIGLKAGSTDFNKCLKSLSK
jgi:hypothetical protein